MRIIEAKDYKELSKQAANIIAGTDRYETGL